MSVLISLQNRDKVKRGNGHPAPPPFPYRPSELFRGGFHYANCTAANPAAGVAHRLSEIIRLGMNDHSMAQDSRGGRAVKNHTANRHFIMSLSGGIGFEITQIASIVTGTPVYLWRTARSHSRPLNWLMLISKTVPGSRQRALILRLKGSARGR